MDNASKASFYKIIKVKEIDTPRFIMNPADLKDYFPWIEIFELKRVYWVKKPKGSKNSGQHAHVDEDGIFVVLQGKAKMILDGGDGRKEYKVSENNIIWVPRYVWHGMKNMSYDFIVLILSNKNYDEKRKGYIENYKTFKREVGNK
jgi:mannose-6-phosphate isomerase-like protein (cupin superfamily)